MASAFVLQCARLLLLIVGGCGGTAPFTSRCCPMEDLFSLEHFACAKVDSQLGYLTIPKDNQIRIDSSELKGQGLPVTVLQMNAEDNKIKMTVVAGPFCRSKFSTVSYEYLRYGYGTKCEVGNEEHKVSPNHQPTKCPDAGGCKEFSFSCSIDKIGRIWAFPGAIVFNVSAGSFPQSVNEHCHGWRAYIDDARLLLDDPIDNPMGKRVRVPIALIDVTHSRCKVGKQNKVSANHQPNECPDANECKEFSFSCQFPMSTLPGAFVFKVEMFPFREAYKKCQWRAYIDDAFLLMDNSI
uniref:MD-2-related lipid-recognition domain-containing protein n=1 Tax=Globodera rostochiensis TaxID=31243 RepID=A0A914H5N5_GLORO